MPFSLPTVPTLRDCLDELIFCYRQSMMISLHIVLLLSFFGSVYLMNVELFVQPCQPIVYCAEERPKAGVSCLLVGCGNVIRPIVMCGALALLKRMDKLHLAVGQLHLFIQANWKAECCSSRGGLEVIVVNLCCNYAHPLA
jgi:hypothetical protein